VWFLGGNGKKKGKGSDGMGTAGDQDPQVL